LKKKLAFAPFSGGIRVIIIEEAQTMRREAANSLLKLLEEPPPDNIFFLIAAGSEPLLPTITSRCQVVAFSPLSDKITARIISSHRPDLNGQQLIMMARMSGGCPGRALNMKFDCVLSLWEQIVSALVIKLPSPAENVEQALFLAREMAALKDGLDLLFDLLRLFFKEAIQLSLQRVWTGLDGSVDIKVLDKARERWSLVQLSGKVDSIDSAAGAIAGNCNRGLVCEVLLSRLSDGF
jgi:DNA polymerase-3 subunit delta'